MPKTGASSATRDSNLQTSDITTNNASTLKHGFLPKLTGDKNKTLAQDGSLVNISAATFGKEYVFNRGFTCQ